MTVTNEVNEIQEKSADMLAKGAKDVTESTQKGIKEVTDSTQKGIKEITDTTQETIFGGSGNNQKTNSNNDNSSPNNSNPETQTNENTMSYETLSLKTTQQSDDSVMLQYEDTSGKTISVSVTLRTTERELFSGIFYSSMFETFVNDASNSAYFIDMIVEHEEYGTISSSVYNPRDAPNTIINGVFSESQS